MENSEINEEDGSGNGIAQDVNKSYARIVIRDYGLLVMKTLFLDQLNKYLPSIKSFRCIIKSDLYPNITEDKLKIMPEFKDTFTRASINKLQLIDMEFRHSEEDLLFFYHCYNFLFKKIKRNKLIDDISIYLKDLRTDLMHSKISHSYEEVICMFMSIFEVLIKYCDKENVLIVCDCIKQLRRGRPVHNLISIITQNKFKHLVSGWQKSNLSEILLSNDRYKKYLQNEEDFTLVFHDKDMKIVTFEDIVETIFFSDEERETYVIYGEEGSGKTTLCKQIVNYWTHKIYKSNEAGFKYNAVLPIDIREKSFKSLYDYLEFKLHFEIENFFENCSVVYADFRNSPVLFIINGFDGYSESNVDFLEDILCYFPKSNCIITTSAWHSDRLNKHLLRFISPSSRKEFHIKGVKLDEANKFALNIFKNDISENIGLKIEKTISLGSVDGIIAAINLVVIVILLISEQVSEYKYAFLPENHFSNLTKLYKHLEESSIILKGIRSYEQYLKAVTTLRQSPEKVSSELSNFNDYKKFYQLKFLLGYVTSLPKFDSDVNIYLAEISKVINSFTNLSVEYFEYLSNELDAECSNNDYIWYPLRREIFRNIFQTPNNNLKKCEMDEKNFNGQLKWLTNIIIAELSVDEIKLNLCYDFNTKFNMLNKCLYFYEDKKMKRKIKIDLYLDKNVDDNSPIPSFNPWGEIKSFSGRLPSIQPTLDCYSSCLEGMDVVINDIKEYNNLFNLLKDFKSVDEVIFTNEFKLTEELELMVERCSRRSYKAKFTINTSEEKRILLSSIKKKRNENSVVKLILIWKEFSLDEIIEFCRDVNTTTFDGSIDIVHPEELSDEDKVTAIKNISIEHESQSLNYSLNWNGEMI